MVLFPSPSDLPIYVVVSIILLVTLLFPASSFFLLAWFPDDPSFFSGVSVGSPGPSRSLSRRRCGTARIVLGGSSLEFGMGCFACWCRRPACLSGFGEAFWSGFEGWWGVMVVSNVVGGGLEFFLFRFSFCFLVQLFGDSYCLKWLVIFQSEIRVKRYVSMYGRFSLLISIDRISTGVEPRVIMPRWVSDIHVVNYCCILSEMRIWPSIDHHSSSVLALFCSIGVLDVFIGCSLFSLQSGYLYVVAVLTLSSYDDNWVLDVGNLWLSVITIVRDYWLFVAMFSLWFCVSPFVGCLPFDSGLSASYWSHLLWTHFSLSKIRSRRRNGPVSSTFISLRSFYCLDCILCIGFFISFRVVISCTSAKKYQ